jgi:hypothetical protein
MGGAVLNLRVKLAIAAAGLTFMWHLLFICFLTLPQSIKVSVGISRLNCEMHKKERESALFS